MKLYHGTTEAVARQALTYGLLPRSVSGTTTRWEDCPSNPDLVYLTQSYAPYFAMSASEPGERWGILEIDIGHLDEKSLLPDEDFMEQASRDQDLSVAFGEGFPEGNNMTERTEWFRDHLPAFRSLWLKSLKGLGNCAHEGPIPAGAVTRAVLFDAKTNHTMATLAMDPTISLMNHLLCGDKYRALTHWFMGEDVDPIRFLGIPGMKSSKGLPAVWHPLLEQWGKALSLRQGLETLHQG